MHDSQIPTDPAAAIIPPPPPATPAERQYIVDFDDFSQGNHEIDLLYALLRIPGFKVTLFTIPGQCTPEWLHDIIQHPGIELALHGQHHTHLECRDWSEQKTVDVLKMYEEWGCFQKIFKAPFWEITDHVYRGVRKAGWALADHEKNRGRAPTDIPIYFLGPDSVHGHIQNVCGNGLPERFKHLVGLRGRFYFIREVLDGTYARERATLLPTGGAEGHPTGAAVSSERPDPDEPLAGHHSPDAQ